jgi:enterochelin esterase-like enzyme
MPLLVGGHDTATWRPLAESMLLRLFPAGETGW